MTQPKPKTEFLDPLAIPRIGDRIDICEPRLAMSASVAADVLLDIFAAGVPAPSNLAAEPIADAAAIRNQYGFNGSGQTVAVIDTGIAWDHVAFANGTPSNTPGFGPGQRVVGGWDFAENDPNPYDDGPSGFHGTHVAGTIAGWATGFAGVAPGADIVSLRVFDDFGRGSLDWIESALRWVIDHRTAFENPITTVNLSLGVTTIGGGEAISQLDDELRTLRDDGVLIVAAAGNSYSASSPNAIAYPASNPLVAAVTSVDTSGDIQGYAQRSGGIFATVGSQVRSAVPDYIFGIDGKIDDYTSLTGTSMAAPQVAGASMIVREAMQSVGQSPSPDDILTTLRDTAQHRVDPSSGASYFVVDLRAAVQSVLAAHPQADSPATDSPLQWTGSTLTVHGTTGNDQFILDLSGDRPRITLGHDVYPIDRPLTDLVLDGHAGADSLQIIGSVGNERVIARGAMNNFEQPEASLETPTLRASFHNFSNLVFHGGGGNDRATFYDSPGNDTLDANPAQATLRGAGYSFSAIDVNSVYAHAVGGGSDVAYLYDGAGNDTLAIRYQFTSLRGDDMFRLAYGFEKVYAFAGAGGNDVANIYDSPGDDRMSASGTSAWISGRDYYAGATGFQTINANSTAGGNDYATLYATDPSDSWTRSANLLQLRNQDGFLRAAQGFATADSFVGGVKTNILPQSIPAEYFEHERETIRQLFADDDIEERPNGSGVFDAFEERN